MTYPIPSLEIAHASGGSRGGHTSLSRLGSPLPQRRQTLGCRRRGAFAAGFAPRRRLHQRDDGLGHSRRLAADLNFGAVTGHAPDARQRGEVKSFYRADDPFGFEVEDHRRHSASPFLSASSMPATCIETRTKNWEPTP